MPGVAYRWLAVAAAFTLTGGPGVASVAAHDAPMPDDARHDPDEHAGH